MEELIRITTILSSNQKKRMNNLVNTKNDLMYLIENGILDPSQVHDIAEQMKKNELLKMHPYKMWEGTNGKWYTYLPDEEKGRCLKKRNTKADIEKLIIDYWKKERENPTINDVFNEWNDRRLMLNKICQSTHMRNQQYFERHFGEFGRLHIKDVTPEEIQDFLEEQIAEYNLSAKAFSNIKSITRGFLKRAKRKGYISFNVDITLDELDLTENEFHRQPRKEEDDVFTEDELIILTNYLKCHLDIHNLGILLMLVTGIRVGELVALKFTDFDENTVFHIFRTETRFQDENGKNHHEIKDFPKTPAGIRTVIIPEKASWIIEKIKELNPDGEYLMMTHGKRLSTDAIRKRQYRVCKWAGLSKEKSPHKCRKTFASILLDNRLDQKIITQQMEQTDITTTEIHYHRNRKSVPQKKEIINAIPEFNNL